MNYIIDTLIFLPPISLLLILTIRYAIPKKRYYNIRGKRYRWSDKENAFLRKGERITFNQLNDIEVAGIRWQYKQKSK